VDGQYSTAAAIKAAFASAQSQSCLFCQVDYELGKLLHVYDVLGILCVGVYDLRAASNLSKNIYEN